MAALAGCVLVTNQIHKWAHLDEVPPSVRWLQDHRLVLSRPSSGTSLADDLFMTDVLAAAHYRDGDGHTLDIVTRRADPQVDQVLSRFVLAPSNAADDLADVQAWLTEWTTVVLRVGGRLVGAARGRRDGEAWDIGRIMVAPDLQGRGIGRLLLTRIEQAAPEDVTRFVLFTGARSERNLRLYRKAGYRPSRDVDTPPGAVGLTKPRRLSRP